MARNTKVVSPSATLDVVVLENAAVEAFKGIDAGMASASKAVLAYVLGCKEAKVTPPVFEAGIARISAAIPGVLKVTAGAYISNAKRIFAADADKLEVAKKSAGTDSIKALAAACPAVSKKGGGTKGEAAKKPDAPKPVLVATKTSAPTTPDDMTQAQWLASVGNMMLVGRKMFPNKRAFIAAIGGIEEMLDEMKPLAA